jgi:hypothetical protein
MMSQGRQGENVEVEPGPAAARNRSPMWSPRRTELRHPARHRVHGRRDGVVLGIERVCKMAGRDLRDGAFSSLVVCAAFILPFTGFSVFATRRPGAHIARGLSQSISQTFSIIAFSMMPLGRHQFLRSAVVGVALGIVAQGTRRSGSLAGAAGGIPRRPHRHQSGRGFAPGRRTVGARQRRDVWQLTTATESATTLRMWQMVTIAVFHSFLLLFGCRWPAPLDTAMLVCGGGANAIAQHLWTRALHLAPAMAVSPFFYLMLVWALVIGYVVWGDVPTAGLLVGSAIVVALGLFLLWHESQRRRSERPAFPAIPLCKEKRT